MASIRPAYGRDYTSAATAIKDWKDGKDFILCDITSRWDGKPCSIRDFERSQSFELRYAKLSKLTIVHGSK